MRRSEFAALLLLSPLWGSAFLLIKLAVRTIPPFTLVFFRIGLVGFEALQGLGSHFWAQMAIICTAVAYLIYYFLLARVGATNTSTVTYVLPLVGVFWGVLLLGEQFHWRTLAALALILAGIAGTSGVFSKRRYAKKITGSS